VAEKIAAVVVTFNRLELLKECVNALHTQSRPLDVIIIVNNGSTDGTQDWLNTQKDIQAIHQENVGSSGGFHAGIEAALTSDADYDYVWLMDDDGFPETKALEILLEHVSPDTAVANSLVMAKEAPGRMAFAYVMKDEHLQPPIFWWAKRNVIRTKDDLVAHFAGKPCFPGAYPFNGTLVSLEKLRKAGNVNTRFFIRGEEIDLVNRLKRQGEIFIVPNAIHYHPSTNVTYREASLWKLYYALRNTIYITNVYYSKPALRNLVNVAAFLYLFLGHRNVRLYFIAIRDGMTGNLGDQIKPFSTQ